ncbi:MAG: PaaI family thioesterase [Sandaracinus sp.]|nr:PaaI family thioesterase [Sandaracinus sp.]MCB9619218.1 PaaI family thioesterase [Sandaracinus sp.]MCB9631463.1 PaaI family thioesterase [Sandaracinus sp.]
MSDFLAVLAEAKRQSDPSGIAPAVPYLHAMGIETRLEGDVLVCTMRFSEPLIGNFAIRALHGGTLGALLESAAATTLLWRELLAAEVVDERLAMPRIVSLTVDYLRTGRAVDTHARAFITSAGRRVARIRAEAWQDDPERPVAAAQASFLVG